MIMPDATAPKPADITAATSASLRKVVADGLRQRLSDKAAPLPPRLQSLLDEMRRRELACGDS
jgi:hypothetical protein